MCPVPDAALVLSTVLLLVELCWPLCCPIVGLQSVGFLAKLPFSSGNLNFMLLPSTLICKMVTNNFPLYVLLLLVVRRRQASGLVVITFGYLLYCSWFLLYVDLCWVPTQLVCREVFILLKPSRNLSFCSAFLSVPVLLFRSKRFTLLLMYLKATAQLWPFVFASAALSSVIPFCCF